MFPCIPISQNGICDPKTVTVDGSPTHWNIVHQNLSIEKGLWHPRWPLAIDLWSHLALWTNLFRTETVPPVSGDTVNSGMAFLARRLPFKQSGGRSPSTPMVTLCRPRSKGQKGRPRGRAGVNCCVLAK